MEGRNIDPFYFTSCSTQNIFDQDIFVEPMIDPRIFDEDILDLEE